MGKLQHHRLARQDLSALSAQFQRVTSLRSPGQEGAANLAPRVYPTVLMIKAGRNLLRLAAGQFLDLAAEVKGEVAGSGRYGEFIQTLRVILKREVLLHLGRF